MAGFWANYQKKSKKRDTNISTEQNCSVSDLFYGVKNTVLQETEGNLTYKLAASCCSSPPLAKLAIYTKKTLVKYFSVLHVAYQQ